MANVEGLILHQGLLSQEDIEEIHRVFVMMDTDGTGALSVGELRAMAVQITKDPNISIEESRQLYSMLDTNCDGVVCWEEFLQFVCKWLHERGGARVKPRTDLPSSFNEKDTLHKCIAQLFSLDKVSFDTTQLPSDHVDNRAETWDYLGAAQQFSDQEKTAFFTGVFQTLSTPGCLQKIVDEVTNRDFSLILSGLKGLTSLLSILSVFQTPRDRSKISLFLVQLFELLIQSNVMPRVIQCLSIEHSEIQWEALKVLTFFSPGPRVPGLPATHAFHPTHRTTKSLIISAGAIPLILRLCESPCLEVRDQALLCTGFLSRHDGEARDFIVSLGAAQILIRMLAKSPEALLVDLSSVIRATWVLSIICGATIPRESAQPKFSSQELLEIGITLAKLFILQEQDNLIANSLTALAYILPYMSPDQNCKVLLERVVVLIRHQNVTVKRAALQTVRNLVWGSAAHSQLLTEVGLYPRLNEILSNPVDVVVKLDAFTVLRSLIQKGYTYEMMNLSLFTQQLQLTIASDPDLRWEAVRLCKVIAFSNFRIAIEDMIRQGMTRTLFQYMICFREVSPVFASAYGVNCFTYNFSFLNDCAMVLDKFAVMGWATGDPMMANTFTKFFDREEATFLFEVIKVLTSEVRKGNQDLYNLNHGEVNLEKSLCELIDHFIKIHSLSPGVNSRFLVEYLTNILNYFRSVLHQTNFQLLAQSQITPDRILSCVRTFTIKCFDLNNYPNGDNRLIQNIRREDLTFYSLKQLIAQQYGYEKVLQFLDARGDKIMIQSEDALRSAVFTSVQAAFEQYFAYFQSINRPIPSPLELPNAEVRLLVSGTQYYMPGYTGTTDYSAYMFRSEKEKFIATLSAESRIDGNELRRIYEEFAIATSGRGTDGRIDLPSFQSMMSRLFGPRCASRELFSAVDIDRRGLIDFRNFIVTLGQLRMGSLEDKIWIAFRAFNLNNTQSFEKEEMADMVRSMNDLKGVAVSEYDVTRLVNQMYAKFDYDRDGRMNYQEFREAMLSNLDSLQPFFNSFPTYFPRI